MKRNPAEILDSKLPCIPGGHGAGEVEISEIRAMRSSMRLQELSSFAMPDSSRNKVCMFLRKRGTFSSDVEKTEAPNSTRKRQAKEGQVKACEVKLTEVGDPELVSCKLAGKLGISDSVPFKAVTTIGKEGQDPHICKSLGTYRRLHATYFQCDALELAPKLLGKLIRREDVILQITEVEAYRPHDSACHGRFGQTARTSPLFGPAGHAYIYLCYGLHIMLNVVADKVGIGAAVLIRACAPVAGMDTIKLRRGQVSDKPTLLNGPGKVGQALGITTDWSNHPLYSPGGLEILDAPEPASILVGPRVGIDYAAPDDVAALWRFALAGTAWISSPRGSLKPLHL